MNHQSRFDAGYRMLGAETTQRDGIGREEGGGFQDWEHVYTRG